MTKKLDPTQSKCWTCRHGLCLRETEQQVITSLDDGIQVEEDEAWLRNSFDGEEKDAPQEHILEHGRVKTVCFANPAENDEAVGILTGFVHECNRHESH